MVIEYALINIDFLEYQLYESSKSESTKKKRFKTKVIPSVLYLIYGIYLWYQKETIIAFIIFGFTAVLWLLLYPKYEKWKYKKHLKNHVLEDYKNRINKTVEIKFDKNFINTKDYTSESKINGTEIKELIEIKNHFYIKLRTDMSLIIPKKAINDHSKFKSKIIEFGAEYKNDLNWEWK